MSRCWHCAGTGRRYDHTGTPVCPLCRGQGDLHPTVAAWRDRGARLRAQRHARSEPLRAVMQRSGYSIRDLMAMESGLADPAPLEADARRLEGP